MSKVHLPIEEGETPCPSKIGDKKSGDFNPRFMYGEFAYLKDDGDCPKEVLDWINREVNSFIPEEYRHRVEILHKKNNSSMELPLTIADTIGWKYIPEIPETPSGNEMEAFIESRLTGKGGGMQSYKKNGYRYTIQKTKVDNE